MIMKQLIRKINNKFINNMNILYMLSFTLFLVWVCGAEPRQQGALLSRDKTTNLRQRVRGERGKVVGNMAAPLDDMFSFCVDAGKVASSVEVRFIDNIKVRPSPASWSGNTGDRPGGGRRCSRGAAASCRCRCGSRAGGGSAVLGLPHRRNSSTIWKNELVCIHLLLV